MKKWVGGFFWWGVGPDTNHKVLRHRPAAGMRMLITPGWSGGQRRRPPSHLPLMAALRDPTVSAGVVSLKAGAQLARVVPSGKERGKPVSTFVQLAEDETQIHLRAKAKALRKGAREAVRLTDVLDLFVGQDASGAADGLALSLWLLPTADDEIGEKIDLIFDDAEVFGLWLVTLRALLAELRPPEPPTAPPVDEERDDGSVSLAAANPWDDQPEPAEAILDGGANPFGDAPAALVAPAEAVHGDDVPPSSSNPFEEEAATEPAAGETSPNNPFAADATLSSSLKTSGATTNPFEEASPAPAAGQTRLRKKKSARSVAKAAVTPPAEATPTSTNPFAAEVEGAEKGAAAQGSTNPFAAEAEGDGGRGGGPPSVVQEVQAEPARQPRVEARRRLAASQVPLPEEMPLKLLAYELLLLSLAADGEGGGGGAHIGEGILEGLRTRLDVSWRQHRELMPLLQPPELAGRGEGHPAGPAHRLALLRAATSGEAAAAGGAKDGARRKFVERQREVLEYVLAARGHPGAAEAALERVVRPQRQAEEEAGAKAESAEGSAWLAGGWPWQLSFALLCALVRAALFEEGLDGELCACADAPESLQLIQATCWAPLGVDARAQALATVRVTWEAYEAGGGADELKAARQRLNEVLWEHAAVARIAMASAADAEHLEAAPATAVAAASTIQRAWRRWLAHLGSEVEAGAGWSARLRGAIDGLQEALVARLQQRLRSLEPLDELPLCVSTLQLAVGARVALGSAAARHAPLALEALLMADGSGGGGGAGGGGLMGDEARADATEAATAIARVESHARAEVARVAASVLRGSVPPQLARLRAMLDDEGEGAGGEAGGGDEGGGGGGGGGVQNAVRGWKDADEDVSEAQMREEQREAARRAAGATRLEGWLEKRRGGGGFGRGGRGGSTWDRRYVVLLPDRLCWGSTAEAWASQAQEKQLLLTPATVVTLEGPHLSLATADRVVVLRASPKEASTSTAASDASERPASSVSEASESASAQPLQPWAEAIHARVVERAIGSHRGDAAAARAARELARVLCDEVEIEPEFTRPFGGLLAGAGAGASDGAVGGVVGGGDARLARGRCDALATTLEEMQSQLLGVYGARAALASFRSLSGDVIKTVAALAALKLRLEQLLRAEALAAAADAAADAADDDADGAHRMRRVSMEAAQAEEVGIGREAFAELPRLCVGIAHGFAEGVERRLGQTLPRALAEETWEGLGATGVSSSVVDVFRSLSDCVSMQTDFALAASLHRGAALATASKPFLDVIGRLVADYATRLVAEARKGGTGGGGGAEAAAGGGASGAAAASVQVTRGAPPPRAKRRGLLGCCGRDAARDVLEEPPREAGFAAELARGTPEAVEAAEARRRRLCLIVNQLGWAEQQVAHLAERMAKQLPAITALPEASLPGARGACASAACSVIDELVGSHMASLAPQLSAARRAAEARPAGGGGGAPDRALTAALRRANLLFVELAAATNPPWRRAALQCCIGTMLAQLEPARVGGAPSAPPQERRGLVVLGDADVSAVEQGLAASGAPLDVDVVHALHDGAEATRAEQPSSQLPSRSAACVSRLDKHCLDRSAASTSTAAERV